MLKWLDRLFAGTPASPLKFHATQVCPECGSRLAQELAVNAGADWQCPNPDCPPRVRRRVILWASKDAMDISNDTVLLEQLVRRGLVLDAAEFYRLKVKELAALDGMDADQAKAFWEAIHASKSRGPLCVLRGLGIPQIGSEEAEILIGHFASLEELFAADYQQLSQLAGVSEAMARCVTRWADDPVNRKLVRRLRRAGVKLERDFEPD